MKKRRLLPSLGLLVCVAAACPEGGGGGSTAVETGSSSETGAPTTGEPTTGEPTTGGAVGPSAQVRIVNLMPGVTFDAWANDTDKSPVLVAQGLAPETISAYFNAPVNEVTMQPEIVLLPAGEIPADDSFWQVNASVGPDRAYVKFTELEGADQRATAIVTLDELTMQVQYEQLDETELMLGADTQANLHIAYALADIGGGVVPAFAVVGEACLFTGSTGVTQPWSVAPGSFELGVYDLQSVPDCTTQLASTPITAAAGEQVLVAVYHVDAEVKLLTAPIEQ
jgi:hypothetical protein